MRRSAFHNAKEVQVNDRSSASVTSKCLLTVHFQDLVNFQVLDGLAKGFECCLGFEVPFEAIGSQLINLLSSRGGERSD